MNGGQAKILFVIAAIALFVGGLVYITDRLHENVYLIPNWLPVEYGQIGLFGNIGDSLPTFVHVYAFILLTSVCLLPSKRQLMFVCAAWFFVDTAFEVAQSAPLARWIANGLANRFEGIPILENVVNYFLSGDFNVWDVCSIVAGTLAAYLTVNYLLNNREGSRYESPSKST